MSVGEKKTSNYNTTTPPTGINKGNHHSILWVKFITGLIITQFTLSVLRHRSEKRVVSKYGRPILIIVMLSMANLVKLGLKNR